MPWRPRLAKRSVSKGRGPATTTIVLPRRHGLRPLVADVVPVVGTAHDVLHPVAAIVALTDLAAALTGPSEALLEQAFGLTPAEGRLAAQIAAGKALAEIAGEAGSARELCAAGSNRYSTRPARDGRPS